MMIYLYPPGRAYSSSLWNFLWLENPVKWLKGFSSLSLMQDRSLKTVTENLWSQVISMFDWMECQTKFSLPVLLYSSLSDAISVNSSSRTALISSIFLLFCGNVLSRFSLVQLKNLWTSSAFQMNQVFSIRVYEVSSEVFWTKFWMFRGLKIPFWIPFYPRDHTYKRWNITVQINVQIKMLNNRLIKLRIYIDTFFVIWEAMPR